MGVKVTGGVAGGTHRAQERIERDRRIAEARAAGEPWDVIAEREGVSRSTAKRAARTYGSAVVLPVRVEDIDSDAVLVRVVRSHLAMLGASERLAVGADNSNARVGAARVAASIGRSLLDLLALTGLLRGHRGLEAFHEELAQAARVVQRLAAAHGIPDDEVLAAFDAIGVAGRDAEVVS